MERCPVCRARFKGDASCSRCGSDLAMLLQIETEAAALEQRAITLLKNNEFSTARRIIKQAQVLKYSPLAAAVLNFLAQNSDRA